MSDLPEADYVAYVDGELPAEERRALERHLVRSQEARARVLALQEEAGLLSATLQERAQRERAPVVAAAPARGLATGAVPVLGAGALMLLSLGWLLEARAPSGLGWLNPMRLIGAYEMAIDVVFWLRDAVPGLIELGVAVGVTASVSALLSFGVSLLLRRVGTPGTLALLLCASFGASLPSSALDLRFGEETVRVRDGEVLADTLITGADSVYIEGVVEGDLVAFTDRLLVRGVVRGNVFAFAQSIEIAGVVEGSLYSASERLELKGEVRHDVVAAGDHINLLDGGTVGRDATHFASALFLDGEVRRHLFSAAERAEISGRIGGDADLRGERAVLLTGAVVAGDLRHALHDDREPEIAPGATVAGSVVQESWGEAMGKRHEGFHVVAVLARALIVSVSAFVLGILLHLLAPALFEERVETGGEFFQALGMGLIALVTTPAVIVLAFLTVVGIPLGVIGLFIYVTALFVSLVVVAALIGRTLLRRGPGQEGFGLALLAGLAVLALATSIPWLGGLVRIIVLLTGLGLLVRATIRLWRASHSTTREAEAW